MDVIEKLIKSLQEAKAELEKNMNCAPGMAQNMGKIEEPHKDDPNHEKKEKKAASKIKEEAEDILDMHKEELTCSANGQWSLKKDAANPALAPKAKKVKALQQQIDAGTYKPDSKKIAGAMLKSEDEGLEKNGKTYKVGPDKKPMTMVKPWHVTDHWGDGLGHRHLMAHPDGTKVSVHHKQVHDFNEKPPALSKPNKLPV